MSLSFKESLNQISSGDFIGNGGNWQNHPSYTHSDIYTDRSISTISSKKNIRLNSRQFNITQEENSQYIPFEMPRFYDGLDLVNATISIHYETSGERHGAAQPINVIYNDNKIRFGWLIDSNVTSDPGKLKFEIHAYGVAHGANGETTAYVWKSKSNEKLNVLESICRTDEVITEVDGSWVQELVTDITERVAESLRDVALKEQVQTAVQDAKQYADDLNTTTSNKIKSIDKEIDVIFDEIENFSADSVQYVAQKLTDAQMAQARKNINANGFDWHAIGEHNGYAANMSNYNSIMDWDELLTVPSSTSSSTPAFGTLLAAVSVLLTGYDKGVSKESALKDFNAAILDLSNAGISPSGYRIVHTLDVENANKYLFVVMQYNANNNRWILTDQTGDVTRFVAVTGDEIIDDTTLIYPDATLSIDGRAADAKAVGQALGLKAELEHNHKISNIDGLQVALDNKASLLHDHDGDYDAKGAAVAALEAAKYHANDVAGAIRDDLLNGAGSAYDTLKELGELIDDNHDAIAALEKVAANKANADHNHNNVYDTKGAADSALTAAKKYTDDAIEVAKNEFGGEGSDPEAVKYVEQTLTEEQKTQARDNIGAIGEDYVTQVVNNLDFLKPNMLPTKVSQLENDAEYVSDAFMRKYVANAISSSGGVGGGTGTGGSVKLENLSGFTTKSVAAGDDLAIAFNFTSIVDDEATGDGSCQITVNDVVKSTQKVKQGYNEISIVDYLSAGTNTVIVRVTDIYGGFKLLNYTITMIDLRITSTFDDTLTYNDVIQYKYTPYGAIEKTIHILVDGTEIHTNTVTTSGRQVTVNIPKQAHGVHRIETYMTAVLEEDDLTSNRIISDVICIEEGSSAVLISSVYEEDEMVQGTQVSIPYIVYSPAALSAEVDLIVSCGGEEHSKKTITVDRKRQYWNIRNYPVGDVSFTIKCGEVSKTHTVKVAESDIEIIPITNDLELYLTSTDRSNGEENPAVWEYGDVTTTFENVNWDSTGWATDENGDSVLRLNGGATATISFKPFKDDFKVYGKTLEFEFTIRDVNNRDAKVILSWADKIGMEMTADRATLNSQQTEIFCNYAEEERVRVSFVVESRTEYRLMHVYLNGILSGVKQYPANDNFQQTTPVDITIGSEYCGVDIYNIRSYSNALTFGEVINNYIADTADIGEKLALYEENNLYDEYGALSYEKIKSKIPVMTIIGSLPQTKGDKKNVSIKFEHNTNSTLSFLDSAIIDVQGTSSAGYVRKNYKIKTSEQHLHAEGQMPTNVFCTKADYAEATGTHNTQNANLVETLYSEKTPAQLWDSRCRTTIFGYPIVIFHQATETDLPVFIGKYNFNFDKGSEDVFGFNSSFDVESWEFCNNTSDQCNFLAPIGDDWSADFEARYPDKHKDISRFKTVHDWVVSTKDNVDKFKAEFENYFDLHFALIYYVYTSIMLMVDQRAKNMFLTYWGETGKWQPWFYDNDTCLGINNEGRLIFDYYHEDTDYVGQLPVYTGQNSVLWNNFREAFADEIQETYQDLRNNGKITYDKIVDQFIEKGSRQWSASIYNEDSDYKYISMLRSDNNATYLYQVRGNGEGHLKYFVSNRLKYLDSKWLASDFINNIITLRINTPQGDLAVPADASIKITPFSNMYAGVKYTANSPMKQQKVTKNVQAVFSPDADDTFTGIETYIYGASEISSLDDLAPMYCSLVDVSKATRLVNIKIGDGTEGYVNENLTDLSVGTNKLLKTIDIRNCPNLTNPLALSGCPNIEEIYATGSGITGVELAESGYLKKVHLPETITNFTLKNQLYINDLQMAGYDNIATINIENCPSIDELDILEKSTNVQRVRLTNVDWHFDDVSFLVGLVDKGIKGVDENGLNVDIPQISGNCHIEVMTGDDMASVKAYFPYLNITYTTLTATVTYMNGDVVLGVETVYNGGNAVYTFATPTKESTAQFDYVHYGWSSTPDGVTDENTLNNVVTNKTVYATFIGVLRFYTIRFLNDTTVLQSSSVAYGEIPVYTGEIPTKEEYAFVGWTPTLTSVTGDADYQVKWKSTVSFMKSFVQGNITTIDNDQITSVGDYGLYAKSFLTDINLPNVTSVGDYAFASNTAITNINLPNVTSVGNNAFNGCQALTTIDLPNVTSLGAYAFGSCRALITINIPKVTNINAYTFNGCQALTTIDLPNVVNLGDYAFNTCNILETVDLPKVTSVGTYAFYNCKVLDTVNVPNATSISTSAFYGCQALTTIDLPKVTNISQTTFYNCSALTTIDSPNVISIGNNAFYKCSALTTADFPNVTSIDEYAFQSCHSLTTVILRSETVATLANRNAFNNCYHILGTSNSTYNPTGAKDGYIYVPRTLVDSYKSASNWSNFSSQIRAIEDYPEICGEV